MLRLLYGKFDGLFRQTGLIFLLLVQGLVATPTLGRGWRRFVIQLNRIGVDSLPLVLMIGLFQGMVLALQTGIVFKRELGAEEFVGAVVGLSLVREMGPVITAFILAGRVGSSMAAELGTMAVSEEIDALRSMGISPVSYLFVPRLWAMLIMQPLLTVFSIAIGIWGGGLVVGGFLNFPTEIYFKRTFEAIMFGDLINGLTKSVMFAVLTVTISTQIGMSTRHGAEGVGRATTMAVVVSLVMVLISDYLMTRFLF